MFAFDYLQKSNLNQIVVPPSHYAHVGILSRNARQHIALLQSTLSPAGCELCITPYARPLEYLFRLKCVLRNTRGALHGFLRAIAAMDLNILSCESATFESMSEHRISMLLDWSTTPSPTRAAPPKNLREVFFPVLSAIIPRHDLRYVRLLRQILAQCGDTLLWDTEAESNVATPRLRFTEFDETRVVAVRGTAQFDLAKRPANPQGSGIALEIDPRIAADVRVATGRSGADPLYYALLSDIESETLRVLIPRRGREKRIAHVGFSHDNLPGALCALTDIIARSQMSIVSSMLRAVTAERNIFEVTLEHDTQDLPVEELADPATWAAKHLRLGGAQVEEWLKYYRATLESPRDTRGSHHSVPLHSVGRRPDYVTVITADQAERDVLQMAARAVTDEAFVTRRWLTDLLFAPEWGPQGKPSVFLSYSRVAADEAALVRRTLEHRFHVVVLQDADIEHITEGAITRVIKSHCFIGVWRPETIRSGSQAISPWMPFEYGVALSHHKPCVILSHRSLPSFIADRISRDTAHIAYSNLASEPEKLAELVRRCEPWEAAHRRLNVTTAESPLVPENRHFKGGTAADEITTGHLEPTRKRQRGRRKPLSVFVSYTRESDDHSQWVRTLADALERFAEFDVTFDQYDLHGGKDLLHFMDRGLACERIVIVITPEYVRKATKRIGGVGYESSVISSDVLTNQLAARVVPVLRCGDKVPPFLRSKLYVDLREGCDFLVGITDLHRALHGKAAARRPPKQTSV
jgi:hypothetical protein